MWNSIEEFTEYYQSHSLPQTAAHFSVCRSTVCNWAKKLGLAKKIPKSFTCPSTLTELQHQLLLGSLLGDGSLSKRYGKKNSRFTERHSEKQMEYLMWKERILQPFSSKITREISYPTSLLKYGNLLKDEYISYCLSTVNHKLFSDLERQWYLRNNGNYVIENGKRVKIVPDNLRLTPLIVAVWYFDDGTNVATHRSVYIYTDCFDYKTCNNLCSQLIQLGIVNCRVANKENDKYEIYIGGISYLPFMEMVAPFLPCESMRYKIDISNFPTYKYPDKAVAYGRAKLSVNDLEFIHDSISSGLTYLQIAKQLKVCENTIQNVVSGKTYKEIGTILLD